MIKFEKDILSDYEKASSKEWVLTNGIGGYASSTVICANTRKYHGLLVAALEPPVGRMVLVSKLEETVLIHKDRYDLSCSQYPGTVHPEGYKYLTGFEAEPFPRFTYDFDGIILEKSIFMVYGENTTVVSYKLISSGDKAVVLLVRPLIAARDFHWVSYENQFFKAKLDISDDHLKIKPYDASPEIFLCHNAEQFEEQAYWYRDFEYKREYERGLESYEDNYSPGHLVYILRPGEKCFFVASTQHKQVKDVQDLEYNYIQRSEVVNSSFKSEDELFANLARTSDSFLVKRDGLISNAIAGYHWHSDWMRDTLIAFPGLVLVTGRYDIARNILANCARYCREGLMPTMFPERSGMPDYSSVDTSLWYFYAVGKYLEYTQDREFVKKFLFNTLIEIMDYYIRGTYYGIRLDADGLITFAERELPLTWMNARVQEAPVTPRYGKVVEINALWYNALKIMQGIIADYDKKLEQEYSNLSGVTKENFLNLFWNKDDNCLYDWVDGVKKDVSIRPNQVLAVSLPNAIVPKKQAAQIVEVVKNQLLTPYGLKTLSAGEKDYKGKYEGGQYQRDGACHQGTIWPWLLGHYITAFLKANGRTKENIETAKKLLDPFKGHLSEAGVGTISEMFDADPPHEPKGCISQAINVAEMLRAYAEDIEARKPIELAKSERK